MANLRWLSILMMLLSMARTALADAPIYRCASGGRISYGAFPCDNARIVGAPALYANDADRAAAERRSQAEIARADRFVERTRRDAELEAKRRHQAALEDRRVERARLKKEEAEARKAARARDDWRTRLRSPRTRRSTSVRAGAP